MTSSEQDNLSKEGVFETLVSFIQPTTCFVGGVEVQIGSRRRLPRHPNGEKRTRAVRQGCVPGQRGTFGAFLGGRLLPGPGRGGG